MPRENNDTTDTTEQNPDPSKAFAGGATATDKDPLEGFNNPKVTNLIDGRQAASLHAQLDEALEGKAKAWEYVRLLQDALNKAEKAVTDPSQFGFIFSPQVKAVLTEQELDRDFTRPPTV